MPASQPKRSMASCFKKRIGSLTPKGRSLATICVISLRPLAVSPDEVPMMPTPPARETAVANGERAIQPIGACTMGWRAPGFAVAPGGWSTASRPPAFHGVMT